MRKYLKVLTAVLAIVIALSVVPFVNGAEETEKTYKITSNVVKTDVMPVPGEKYFAVGHDIYDSDGNKFASLAEDEYVQHIMDNFILSRVSEYTEENGFNELYSIYSVKDGKLSKLRTHECHNSIIVAYDGGEYTFLAFIDLTRWDLYKYEVVDGDGKALYSAEVANIERAVFGDGVIVFVQTDGKNVLVSGFGDKLVSREIPGEPQESFTNGLALFTVDGNFSAKYYGVMNDKGEVIAEAKYAMATVLDNGYVVLYDKYATREGCGEGIHVIDKDGKVVYEDLENNWDIIAFYGDTYILLDPFGTYGFMRVGDPKHPIEYCDYYYSELDYHYFANDENAPGKIYDSNGDLILEDVRDFSTDGTYITARDAYGHTYRIYDTDGEKIYTYRSEPKIYALSEDVALVSNADDSNPRIISRGTALTDVHDLYAGGEIYDGVEIYLMIDVDEKTKEETYTVYFIKESPIPFKDVAESHWAASSIASVYGDGIMKGTADFIFSPSAVVTRAQVVTILWRLAGSPSAMTLTGFSDVPGDKWYSVAVGWAWLKGITDGVGDGRFAPDRPITRAELATLLYRYADVMDIDTSARADISAFPDSGKVESWALDAIRWCVAEGLINGKSTGGDGKPYLASSDKLTRAEIAAVIARFNG